MWFKQTKYTLEEVYGIGEIPPEDCPTYIVRTAHKDFSYAVQHEKQHIVVYGASRQGKTWLVEKYCPNFIRVGCDAKFTREELFKAILHELGVKVGNVQTGSKIEVTGEGKIEGKGSLDVPLIGKKELTAGGRLNVSDGSNEQFTYVNISLSNQTEVVSAIKKHIGGRFIVIENFHYLDPAVQKTFASSLREFLYSQIRVIIVGVWKETTKLVSLASDLSNRVEPIDIGDWKEDELLEIVINGDKSLNTQTDLTIVQRFIENSGRNVGIFKSLMKNFCKVNGIYETQKSRTVLNDIDRAEEAIEKSYQEVIVPTLDRIHKLATSKRGGRKGLRYYIVRALLDIMATSDVDTLIKGIPLNDIVTKIQNYKEETFQPQNIKQELMVLHLRDETVSLEGQEDGTTHANFIPLFYYDQGKDRVFIVESALLAACRSGKVNLSSFLYSKQTYIKSK
jgi:hypothetical protein